MEINEIKKYEDVKTMDKAEAKEYMIFVKKYFSNKEVIEHWNIKPSQFYSLYNTIGIKKEFKNKKTKLDKDNKENTGKRPYNRKNTEVIDIAKQNEGIFNAKLGEFISEAVRLHLENLKPEPKELIENIITSKYGIMSGERLYNFLLKLADYIEKDIEYDITIKIKEALPEPIEIPTQTALPQTTTTGNASYASISYQTTNTSAQVQSIVTNKTEQKPYSLKVEG